MMKMEIIIMLFIGLTCIVFVSAYTPPSYTSVDLVLNDTYTPPSYTAVDLVLSEENVTPTDSCSTKSPLCSDNCNITSTLNFSGEDYHIVGSSGSFSWSTEIKALRFVNDGCALNPSVGNAWTISS